MGENIKKYLPLDKRDLTRQGITKLTLVTPADKNTRLMKKNKKQRFRLKGSLTH